MTKKIKTKAKISATKPLASHKRNAAKNANGYRYANGRAQATVKKPAVNVIHTKPAQRPAPAAPKQGVPARGVIMTKGIGGKPIAILPRAPVPEPSFAAGDYVVYPTHGVGRIQGVETQEIAGTTLKVIIINFEKERMMLRVPVGKASNAGLRRLSSRKEMETALKTLKGRSRIRRMMWSRRAQEYEAKINSGDPISIAEVVRDLHRNAGQPDQSYSERQIYQAALDRLVRELAAVERIDEAAATQKLENVLKAA